MQMPAIVPHTKRPANFAEKVIASCAAVTMLVALLGLAQFAWSVHQEHVKAAQDAIAKIYPLDFEYTRFLSKGLNLRRCMENDPRGDVWAQLDPEERVKCIAACGLLGDIFEYYLLIRDDIVNHSKGSDISKAWDVYLEDQCKNSFIFRGYINSSRGNWSQTLLDAFDRCTKGLSLGAQDTFDVKPPDVMQQPPVQGIRGTK